MKTLRNKKIFIIGAGNAGLKLLKEIINLNYEVVAFIDDDESKIGKSIENINIYGPISELGRIAKEESVTEILIAIPSAQSSLIRKVIEIAQKENLRSKIIPRTVDIIRGLVRFEQIRDIKPQDLLGRPVVNHDLTIAAKKVKEKTILITGAAGSIGSELAKQIAILGSKKLICFDWWENGMFELKKDLKQYNLSDIKYVIGNIQDKTRISQVISQYKPDVIFHAAAYKHVPLMEENIEEAIKNNVIGTKILAEVAIKNDVGSFILVSSDKAINPVSIMGATKRVAEKLMYIFADKEKTKFSGVRFGNVLMSNGSVIPLFEQQIRGGGPVTITDPDMIRYFMTIEEAVQLIIQSWTLGKNGEIFVLDMGEPIKIKDIAYNLIRAHGYVPEKDIAVKIIGQRSGEKLFEEISTNEKKVDKTTHSKIFIIKKEEEFDYSKFLNKVNDLENSIFQSKNSTDIKDLLKELVPSFKPNEKKIILITGGAGFIGTHLKNRFLSLGHKVIVLDKKDGFNIDDQEKTRQVFENERPDIVYHLAGAINLKHGGNDSGINRAKMITELAKEFNLEKIIFFSSGGAIYGDSESNYSKANLEIERIIKESNLDYVILRLANVYGPSQWKSGIIPQIIKNKELKIKGDGSQTRDFIYIDDVIDLSILAMNKNGTYNVGSDREISLNEVIDIIKNVSGFKIVPIYTKEDDISVKALDISKTKKDFNWEPKIDLKEGLSKTIELSENN